MAQALPPMRGSVSGAALIIGAGLTAKSLDLTAGTNGTTSTINFFPSDPVEGESVTIWVSNISGYSDGDQYRELFLHWDFDDSGATYLSGGGRHNDANYDQGRVTAKAWLTSGTKTITLKVYSPSGLEETQTVNITVRDPDAITWDHDIFVTNSAETTGWPAETGNVTHCSSQSDLYSTLSSLVGNGDQVRINFNKESVEVYDLTTAAQDRYIPTWGDEDCFHYITHIGSDTERAKFTTTGVTGRMRFIHNYSGSGMGRVAVRNLFLEGAYDPVTGTGDYELTFFAGGPPVDANDAPVASLFRCKTSGIRTSGMNGGADITAGTPLGYYAVVDNDIENWGDYGFTFYQGKKHCALIGNRIRQAALALLKDGKGVFGAPDHNCARFMNYNYCAANNNNSAGVGGWNPASGGDYAPNPDYRFYPDETTDFNITECNDNVSDGYLFADVGETGGAFRDGDGRFILRGNYQRAQGLSYVFATLAGGGHIIQNNIYYQPDVVKAGITNDLRFVTVDDAAGSAAATVNALDCYIEFNTVKSDRTVAGSGQAADFDWSTGTVSFTVNFANNIFDGRGHSNWGTFTDYGTLSRADDWKLLTGETGDGNVTTGVIPYFDYDGNVRSQSAASTGAHETTVASDAGVSAPSYTSGLTIAENTAYTGGEHHVSDLGTWTGLDEYMGEWEWQLDGTPITNPQRNRVNVTADSIGSGDLRCVWTGTNLSGTRVSATSNAIAV